MYLFESQKIANISERKIRNMKNKLFNKLVVYIIVLILSISFPLNVFANDSTSNFVEEKIEEEILDYDIEIKENIDSLIERSPKRTPEKIAQLSDTKGDNHYVPMYKVDETEIYSEDDIQVVADTYVYELIELDNPRTKVSSSTGNTNITGTDNTVSVRGYCTIYYTIFNYTPRQRRLTSVSGGYTILDSAISVTKQSVNYGQVGLGSSGTVNETATRTPTGRTFSYSTGFTKTLAGGYPYSMFGMNYWITMKRTSSTWTLHIQNQLSF
jgi:hypothetical protein